MPKAEITLIKHAFHRVPGQLAPDVMIMLPPEYITMFDTLVDLLTFFLFPRIQPGVYRGQGGYWQNYPDNGHLPNARTRHKLEKIWSGQWPDVTVIKLNGRANP